MIRTSIQLKALVRNKSHGDNAKAMTLIRNFVMERFLERISLSKYNNNEGWFHNTTVWMSKRKFLTI